MSWFSHLLDFIYPRGLSCFNCGSSILFSEISGLCQKCLQKVELLFELEREGLNAASVHRQKAAVRYEGIIKEMLLAFKYYERKELVQTLGDLMFFAYQEYYAETEIDYIIPIPLHEKRRKMRGYNQSNLLAQYLQEKTKDLVFEGDLLIRLRNTPPLYRLSPVDRRRVLKDSFTLKRRTTELQGSSVLLIDDILTTGSTVREAAITLKREANAGDIYVLTTAAP